METLEDFQSLFSYGTLQIEAVQLATFGRRLEGTPDSLPGYRQTKLKIKDETVVAQSGQEYYLNIQFTGQDSDKIDGTRFQVTRRELEQADVYEEAALYRRISVELNSGVQAWVYLGAESGE